MHGNRGLLHLTGVSTRTVQEGSTGAAGPVKAFLRQYLKVVPVVIILIAHQSDESCPSTTQADHLVSFSKRPDSHRTDCGVQAGYVPTSGQNSDHTFF